MATPDRLIEYVNTQGTDYTRVAAEDILGRKWISVLHPTMWIAFSFPGTWPPRTDTPFELECRLRRFDGQYRWHDLRSRALFDDDGAILKWIGTGY